MEKSWHAKLPYLPKVLSIAKALPLKMDASGSSMDLKEVQVLFIAHRVEVDLEAGDEGVVAAYRFRGVMQL